jgi:hypothetical protein
MMTPEQHVTPLADVEAVVCYHCILAEVDVIAIVRRARVRVELHGDYFPRQAYVVRRTRRGSE